MRESSDLVYRNPPTEGWQGWLFGNGSVGVTLWNPSEGIKGQVGDTDLLDTDPDCEANPEEGQGKPMLRHVGQFSFGVDDRPLFDPHYLYDYTAHQSIETGELDASGNGVIGSFHFTAQYVENPSIFLLRYKDSLKEAASRRFRIQRLGSRILPVSYRRSTGSANSGFAGTNSSQWDARVWVVSHRSAGFACALGASVTSNVTYEAQADDHGVTLIFSRAKELEVEIRLAEATGENAAALVVSSLRSAIDIDSESLAKVGRRQKEALWDDYYVSLPEDRYYEQLWNLGRRYMLDSYRGALPPFFINGAWGWNRDVRMWAGCWFHWNFHGAALALPSLGFAASLTEGYVRWRLRQLDSAVASTRRLFGCEGASFQDLQDPRGDTGLSQQTNHSAYTSAGMQTALHLYRMWRFRGDTEFAGEMIYNYMREIAIFWRAWLQVDDAGRLHTPPSVPYEFHGTYKFTDCLVDQAHLRAFLPAFVHVARAIDREDELTEWCEQALPRLAPFQATSLPLAYVTRSNGNGGREFDNPFFDGEPAGESELVLALGKSTLDNRWVSHADTHFDGNSLYGAFCSSQTAHIYPCGLVTSDSSPEWADRMNIAADERTMWGYAVNALRSIRRYPHNENRLDKMSVAEPNIAWTGHSLELPAFARTGLTDALEKALDFYVRRYQMYPQGMWNYHPRKRWLMHHSSFQDESGERCRLDFNPWVLHFSLEPQGIFAETICLMLLDSVGGVIRLFQAYRKDAEFSLPAEGGFVVTARQERASLVRLEIYSQLGGTCRVRLPWEEATVRDSAGSVIDRKVEFGILSFATNAGESYLVFRDGAPGVVGNDSYAKAAPKEHGEATLGIFKRM